LLSIWPNAATEEDYTGKTPLHWAASAKNNDRCFNLLVQAGADELAVDSVSEESLFPQVSLSKRVFIPEKPNTAVLQNQTQ
jgi:ankyrin repeat protein